MDSTPPLGDAPFQVIGVMCPREGWKCWCTQGLLAGETRLNPPELCTAGGSAGKFLCLGYMYVLYITSIRLCTGYYLYITDISSMQCFSHTQAAVFS